MAHGCGFASPVFQSLVASQICPGWGTREGRGPLRLKYFLHEETLPPLSYTSYLHLLLSLALPLVFLWVGQRCSALAFVLLCADLNCKHAKSTESTESTKHVTNWLDLQTASKT